MTTGKFKDPYDPHTRLYGEVLSTRNDLHFVKVTRRNALPVDPYNTIVSVEEFTSTRELVGNDGANAGYWRRQLRGKDGRFIEMGGGIEWIDSKGDRKLGTVNGFDDEIQRVIVKDSDGNEYKLSADEIEGSAVKAVIPEDDDGADSTETPQDPEEEGSGFDLDELLTSLDNEPVNVDEFLGDESKFPVGGAPLEIKDKQGNVLGKLHKKKDSKGKVSIIFELLVALLPHEVSRIFRGLTKDKK